MAALQNTDKEALYFGTLLYDNNPTGTLAAFGLPSNTTRDAAIEAMINIFRSDKTAWINDIKQVKWNMSANNYTTSPAVQQVLLDTLNQVNGTNLTLAQLTTPAGQFGGASSIPWWQQAINATGSLFGGSTTSTTTSTTPNTTSGSTSTIIIVAIVIVALGGLYFLFKD